VRATECIHAEQKSCCKVYCRKQDITVSPRQCTPAKCKFYEEMRGYRKSNKEIKNVAIEPTAPGPQPRVPRLSMVITAFNEDPKEIEATVRSALDAYPNDRLEIIVVDDGSDRPVSLDSFSSSSSSSSSVKIIRHNQPEGVGTSRNRGYAEALRSFSGEGADVVSFHDAHMRFPLVDELIECCRAEFKADLEKEMGRLGDRASSLMVLAAKAWETDALICSASRDVRKERGFWAAGSDLFWNRRDGLQPKWRLYYREPGGGREPWLRVPCMMGAGYFISRRLAERLSEPTGFLWEDTAGRWGFSEQALAIKAFLLDIPTYVARDVFTRHLYRTANPVQNAGQETWKNVCVSMSRLLHPATFDLRFLPYIRKRIPEEQIQSSSSSSSSSGLPWTVERENAVFTHLCGKNAPVTKAHPDHDWLEGIPDIVRARRAVPLQVLQWRPGEATLLIKRICPDAEIKCIEMPGHRADNWHDACKAAGIELAQVPLGRDYAELPLKRNWGRFELVLISGEMQQECRRVAEKCLAPGGKIIMNERADRFVIEDDERRKEAKQITAKSMKDTKDNIQAKKPRRQDVDSPVTVLLLNWQRPENIGPLLDTLANQTVEPKIILWNNAGPSSIRFRTGNPDAGGRRALPLQPIEQDPRVWLVVNSSENLGCMPRWWLASLADTEFVCAIDDDLMPADEKVLEDAMQVCDEKCPEGIVGFFGWERVEGKHYKGARHINGSGKDRRVDLVKGRFMLFRRALLRNVPLVPPFSLDGLDVRELMRRCDDIYLNLMISRGRPGYHLVPGVLGKRWKSLGKQDKRALASNPGHYDIRHRAVEALLDHFKEGRK